MAVSDESLYVLLHNIKQTRTSITVSKCRRIFRNSVPTHMLRVYSRNIIKVSSVTNVVQFIPYVTLNITYFI